mgnify:CR=1 FL=1|jgi:hypothetical protein
MPIQRNLAELIVTMAVTDHIITNDPRILKAAKRLHADIEAAPAEAPLAILGQGEYVKEIRPEDIR